MTSLFTMIRGLLGDDHVRSFAPCRNDPDTILVRLKRILCITGLVKLRPRHPQGGLALLFPKLQPVTNAHVRQGCVFPFVSPFFVNAHIGGIAWNVTNIAKSRGDETMPIVLVLVVTIKDEPSCWRRRG